MPTKLSNPFRLGAGLFLLALGLRLIYLAEQACHNPLFDHPVVDAVVYSRWADEIVNGQWWWPELRNYLPVYPWFLAVCKWFFYGDNPWSVKVIQAILAALATVLLAAVTRRLFGKLAGVAAGLLFACNWLLIVYDGERYAESLCLFCLVLCLYALFCVAPGWRRTLLAGTSCALACGCRPNLMPLIPLVAFWVFRTGRARHLTIAHAAAVCGLAGLIFLPVLVHNHRLSGSWMLRAQQHWNLYAAMNPAFGGLHPAGGIAFDNYMKEPVLAGCYSHQAQDRYWLLKTRQLLHDRPWAAADNFFLRRGGIFLDAAEWSQEFDVYAFRSYSRLLGLPWPGFGWIFPLASVGLVSMWAGRRSLRIGGSQGHTPSLLAQPGCNPDEGRATSRAADSITTEAGNPAIGQFRAQRFLLACLATAVLFTFLFKVTGRYRLPVTLFLIPFAGAGAAGLWRALWERRWKPLLLPGAVCCAAGLICWPDWADLRHRQTALHEFYMGQKYQSAGKSQEAEAAFRLALRNQPWDANAPCELARLLWKEKRLAEAMDAVTEALRREPEFWRAWNLKGTLATEQNQDDAALACLDRSLAIYPPQPEPWMLKTGVYAKTGRWPEENEAFQKAVALGAGAPFLLAYGLRLEDKGFCPEAVRQYEAVAGDPSVARFDRARARLLLGYVFALRLHEPDRAKQCWRETVDEFADVPFFADQAAFLNGAISEAQYRARVGELEGTSALEWYDFNRGVFYSMQHDASRAGKAFLECMTRGGVSPDQPGAPSDLPQKWAWTMLRK